MALVAFSSGERTPTVQSGEISKAFGTSPSDSKNSFPKECTSIRDNQTPAKRICRRDEIISCLKQQTKKLRQRKQQWRERSRKLILTDYL